MTDPGNLIHEGTAFGVDIWRDAATGDLLASRGGSGPQPLDWPAWAAHHPDPPDVAAESVLAELDDIEDGSS